MDNNIILQVFLCDNVGGRLYFKVIEFIFSRICGNLLIPVDGNIIFVSEPLSYQEDQTQSMMQMPLPMILPSLIVVFLL